MKKINILVVDDNPSIHTDFKKILMPEKEVLIDLKKVQSILLGKENTKIEYSNYTVDSAYQGDEAIYLVESALENNKRYALAFIDVRMPPGIDGIETAKQIWELDPTIQIVICTAYSDYTWDEVIHRLGRNDHLFILKKPFENIEVLQLANALSYKWKTSQKLHAHLEQLEKIIEKRTRKLTRSYSLVRATLEATSDGILVINTKNKVVDYNKKLLTMLKIPKLIIEVGDAHLLRRNLYQQLTNPRDFITHIKAAHRQPGQELHDILMFHDKRIIEYHSSPQKIEKKIIGRVYCFRDITDQKMMEEQLLHRSTHDLLTNLPNRLLLHDRMQQILSYAKKYKRMAAILFVDLDSFKYINDTLGHDAGDEVLKIIAARLKSQFHNIHTLARMGGDEFLIVLPDLKQISLVVKICQKLQKSISKPITLKGQKLMLTASIGISLYPRDGTDVHTLLKNADTANHAAKIMGRNSFNFFTSALNASAIKHLKLESDLRQALQRKEFIIYYQPVIDITQNKIVGAEALLRWRHPKLGLISPNEFLMVAEEIGFMLPISYWILESACTQSTIWEKAGLSSIRISINITSKQLNQANFIEKLSAILAKTEVDPTNLELELTESAIVERTDHVIKAIQAIKKFKLKIAIDDFGTGYSSLSYINQLPIDRIKIDHSFIIDINSNPNNIAVIKAIIAMAQSLKIKVLAEGIENKEQLDFLRANRCMEVQGYYFYKPLPIEELTEILKKENSAKKAIHLSSHRSKRFL